MEILMDDPRAEEHFREILQRITQSRSGEIADQMQVLGNPYRHQWGVALVELREMAKAYQPSHLLALKLWNKQWRESMILATLLDEPSKVTEEQMDYWTRSFENSEIAEQASANLWYRTPGAYAKALEWCRGKKHWIRYTAVHLIGRLAMMDKKSPDEMFEPFYEEMFPLSKDAKLSIPLYRTLIILANRSAQQLEMVNDFLEMLEASGSDVSSALAAEVRAAGAGVI